MEWISVKDKLPEPNTNVLICETYAHSKDVYYAVSYWDGTREPKNRWSQFPDGQDDQPGYYWPTHWMPLPEPPKN